MDAKIMRDVGLLMFLACRTSVHWREASMVAVQVRGMVQIRSRWFSCPMIHGGCCNGGAAVADGDSVASVCR
ncbi:hypothetical protein DEO72_LG8g1675 [Vigna unguiculata]|uniref:Uncharacterized protein n=1 Tax=Vigna unguiculata TaxID=3917 RepID=A0A4D6MQ22_VIGUN|nr:hypothetical protein DEO72_LG8g1675 [Vigna unguiculata]